MVAWLRTGDRRLRLGVGITAAVIGVAALWVLVGSPADPATSPAAASPSAPAAAQPPRVPVLVSVAQRGTGPISVGAEVPIVGQALGSEGIAALELWDGAERVGVHVAADPSEHSMRATWSWTPTRVGPAVLLVRAIDALGRVAQSGVVRLAVAPAEEASLPNAALAVAPGPPELALAVPTIQLQLSDCDAGVLVSEADPAAIGLGILDLGPSSPAFAPAATLAPSGASGLTVPLTGGLHLLVASAYTDDAIVYSDPVEVDVPAACGEGSWNGPVRLEGGKLVLPQAVDRAYAYLTRDGGAAIRIPADPAEFIEPVDGVYDAEPHLPALDAETLAIEGWGWSNGQLISLGTGTWTAPATGGATDNATWGGIPGLATSLYNVQEIVVANVCGSAFCFEETLLTNATVTRPPAGSFDPVERTFRWSTPALGVTSVAWQVFFHKPTAIADLDPPFVVDQGEVPIDDPTGGDFVLDLMPYLTGISSPSLTADDQAKGAEQQFIAILDPSIGTGSAQPTLDGPINLGWLPEGQLPTGGGSDPNTFSFEVPDGVMVPSDLWVRVVPVQGNALLPPSAPVHFSIQEYVPVTIDTSVPDYSDRYALTMQHTVPVAPNPDAARCAVVAEVTDDYDPAPGTPSALIWGAIIDKGYVCYDPPDDDGWSPFDLIETFVEWVSDAWDFVSTAWDDIKGAVVDAVLVAVPCDEFASEDTCQAIAATALDAALVAVGVPPSIPDFDTTIGALKGDIGQAMIELAGMESECALAATAEELDDSVPTCQDIVDAALEEMVAQVELQQHKAAANAIGLSVPPGIILAPHPDGLWKPPSVTITATRINDEPVPVACYLTASMESKLANHGWREMVQVDGKWTELTKEGPVSGYPLSGPAATLPDLALHESITHTIWLSDVADWWETPGAKAWEVWWDGGNPYFSYPGTRSHTWLLLQAGAQLTFSANSNCADSVQQTETLAQSGADN